MLIFGPMSGITSNRVRNVPLGVHQKIAGNSDYPLVGATADCGRQFRAGGVSDINANHREIAVCEFPDVGAIIERNCLPAVCVRVWADSAEKFNWCIHATQHSAKRGKKARIKYSAYTVVHICGLSFPWRVAITAKHRKILGENIRTQRRSLKWSQEKLAEKADLHHNYIGDIERGEENVSVDALARIAAALKVRLSDLVRGV